MKLSIKAGSTSVSVNVFIQDSSSTTGAGLTGLVYNTSGLTCYYALPRAAAVAVTLATLAAVTSAYSSGGFKEIDATNMPGWYRLDIPDAALASGRFVDLHLKGAANMAPLPIEIELTGWDNQDGVRGGCTSLPNAAAGANGGLPTVDANNSVKLQTAIKKNVALAKFPFVMADATTGAAATGKTVTVTRSLDGGAFAGGTLGAVTEVGNGVYYCDIGAGDVNGATMTFKASASGCTDTLLPMTIEP